MEAAGNDLVLQCEHGLDQTCYPGRRLGVTKVALDRPDHKRLGSLNATQGRTQGLHLDRVSQGGTRSVALDVLNPLGRDASLRKGADNHLFLRRAVGCRQSIASTILVDGRAADHRQHPMTASLCVGKPLQQKHPAALRQPEPVGAFRKRLAAAIRREPAQPAKLDEGRRTQHQGHAARKGRRTLAAAQGLASQVHGDQRRRACGVQRDAGPFEPQGIAEPAGGDARRISGPHETIEHVESLQARRVVVRCQADEDARAVTGQLLMRYARTLQCFPAGLEQEPLLGVHGHRFARRDAEETRVETINAGDKTALDRDGLAGRLGVRVVQRRRIPALGRYGHDRVHAVFEHAPERLGVRDPPGEATADAHDGDRVIGCHRGPVRQRQSAAVGKHPPIDEASHGERGRMIERQGGGQGRGHAPAQTVAQLDSHQRIQAQLLEGTVGRNRVGARQGKHPRHFGANSLEQHRGAVGRGQGLHFAHPGRRRLARRTPRLYETAPNGLRRAAQQGRADGDR